VLWMWHVKVGAPFWSLLGIVPDCDSLLTSKFIGRIREAACIGVIKLH
jgi:hypothetical protein